MLQDPHKFHFPMTEAIRRLCELDLMRVSIEEDGDVVGRGLLLPFWFHEVVRQQRRLFIPVFRRIWIWLNSCCEDNLCWRNKRQVPWPRKSRRSMNGEPWHQVLGFVCGPSRFLGTSGLLAACRFAHHPPARSHCSRARAFIGFICGAAQFCLLRSVDPTFLY